MSNLSSTGARDRGHQVGCPAMHDAKATCSCRRPAGADHPDQRHPDHWPRLANDLYVGGFEPGEEVPWYVGVIALVAISLSALFIFWLAGWVQR